MAHVIIGLKTVFTHLRTSSVRISHRVQRTHWQLQSVRKELRPARWNKAMAEGIGHTMRIYIYTYTYTYTFIFIYIYIYTYIYIYIRKMVFIAMHDHLSISITYPWVSTISIPIRPIHYYPWQHRRNLTWNTVNLRGFKTILIHCTWIFFIFSMASMGECYLTLSSSDSSHRGHGNPPLDDPFLDEPKISGCLWVDAPLLQIPWWELMCLN